MFTSSASIFLIVYIGTLILALPALAQNNQQFEKAPSFELAISSENEELKIVLQERLEAYRKFAEKSFKPSLAYKIAEKDLEVLEKALRSEGYYDGEVEYELHTSAENSPALRYTINENPRYTIRNINFHYPEKVSELEFREISLQSGDPAVAQSILDAHKELSAKLPESCLFNIDLSYQVMLTQADKAADITFTLKDSPKAHFGAVVFSGEVDIDQKYLESKLTIKEGACFSRSKLNSQRMELLQTNLLSTANPVLDEQKFLTATEEANDPNESQAIDVVFELAERTHHAVKAGVGYSTDEGPGLRLGWEHRNLFGSGERLRVNSGINDVRKYVDGEYIVPHFFSEKQNLIGESELKREITKAYETLRLDATAIIARRVGDNLIAETGLGLTHSRVTEDESQENFNLIYIPTGVTYNKRDNILNATRGWNAATFITPYQDVVKSDVHFVQWTINGAVFFGAKKLKMKPVIALRGALGASTGTDLLNIPADERFYVGGGGSVRGYSYQTVGNISEDEPVGGKSFSEVSMELRLSLTKTWGMVLFTDGGYAYPGDLPDFGEEYLWGAGLGVRYFTSFAPLRFDIAVPLDKREGIDDSYQLYISIGQAF